MLTLHSERVEVAAVVVSYNSAKSIQRFIDSVRVAAESTETSLVVVDNSSRDDTVKIVRCNSDVLCIASGSNAGYAAGVNVGIAASPPAELTLILTPDLELDAKALTALLEKARSSSFIGVLVPLLESDDGNRAFSIRREPTVLRTLGDALLGAHARWRPHWLGEIEYGEDIYRSGGQVDWATGAAIGVTEACCCEIGKWDDKTFFLYSEETDFCRRARDRGWTVEVVENAVARHSGGGSGTSGILDGILALSRVRYAAKHSGNAHAAMIWLVLLVGHLLRVRRPGGIKRIRTLIRPDRYWQVVEKQLNGSRTIRSD